jgi:hypothetical protein
MEGYTQAKSSESLQNKKAAESPDGSIKTALADRAVTFFGAFKDGIAKLDDATRGSFGR